MDHKKQKLVRPGQVHDIIKAERTRIAEEEKTRKGEIELNLRTVILPAIKAKILRAIPEAAGQPRTSYEFKIPISDVVDSRADVSDANLQGLVREAVSELNAAAEEAGDEARYMFRGSIDNMTVLLFDVKDPRREDPDEVQKDGPIPVVVFSS